MVPLLFGLIPALLLISAGPVWALRFWGQIRVGRLYLFTAALRNFIRRNFPLLGAVRAIRQDGTMSAGVLDPVIGQLMGGRTLAQALAISPRFFPPEYIALIDLGERTGQLSTVLERLTADLEEGRRAREYLFTRLAYPFAMMFVYAGITQFIMLKVLPKFRDIMKEFEARPTRSLELVSGGWWFISLLVAVLSLALLAMLVFQTLSSAGVTHGLRNSGLRLGARFPSARRYELARFAAALSAALTGGATVPEALRLTANAAVDPLRGAALAAADAVAGGATLANALRATGAFPRTFLWMVDSGEAAGRPAEALRQLHELYVARARQLVQFLGSLIIPVTVCFMAAIVLILAHSVLGSEIAIIWQTSGGIGAK